MNHRLLLFDGRAPGATHGALETACRAAVERCGHWVDVCVVAPDERSGRWPTGIHVIGDPQGALRARYRADSPCLYLIRPDGYIAYRSRRWDGLDDYLDRVV